jgi:uridine kinase
MGIGGLAMARGTLPLLALAGGAGSGKSTIARELAAQVPGIGLVHLDDCYHHDPGLAPSVPAFDGSGRIVNFSDPASIDPARVEAAIARHAGAAVIVVEGTFALALTHVHARARWSAYVDAPADIRITRKTLRKLDEDRDPRHVLRGYLEQGRRAHERHVAPTRLRADLVLDGTEPVADLVKQLRLLIRA